MTPTRAAIMKMIHDPRDAHYTAALVAVDEGVYGDKRNIEVLNTLRWHENVRSQYDQRPDENSNRQQN